MDTIFLQILVAFLSITPVYLHKSYRLNQQVMNFISIPSWEMNENFKLPTKHDMLKYIVHMFTWHPFPLFPQWAWNHSNKTHASAC